MLPLTLVNDTTTTTTTTTIDTPTTMVEKAASTSLAFDAKPIARQVENQVYEN